MQANTVQAKEQKYSGISKQLYSDTGKTREKCGNRKNVDKKIMEDSGEFFKNLLDGQATHNQWEKTAVPQSLPQFSDVLNAWNFRGFLQEIRHQTQTKP